MRRFRSGIFLVGLILSLSPVRMVRAAPPDTLLVVFTANTSGQLLDCGCEETAAGGLPRRLAFLRQLQKESSWILLLDGGDLLGTVDRQWQNALVLESYDRMEYDAIQIGDQEFWNGIAFFEKKVVGTDLPLLFSNYSGNRWKDGISRVMRFKKGPFSVAVAGILDPQAFSFFEPGRKPQLPFRNTEEVLEAFQKSLGKGELGIVLFHGDRYRLEELVQKFPGIHVWLLGHESDDLPASWTEGKVPAVVPASSDGQSVELIRVRRAKDGAFAISYRRVYLKEDFPVDSLLYKKLKAYDEHLEKYIQTDPEGRYNNVEACRHCHLLAYEVWERSRHAKAGTLLHEYDEGCVKCHFSPQYPKGISCMDCHQVSQGHGEWDVVDRGAAGKLDQCTRCHTQEWSPLFDVKSYWSRIRHGK